MPPIRRSGGGGVVRCGDRTRFGRQPGQAKQREKGPVMFVIVCVCWKALVNDSFWGAMPHLVCYEAVDLNKSGISEGWVCINLELPPKDPKRSNTCCHVFLNPTGGTITSSEKRTAPCPCSGPWRATITRRSRLGAKPSGSVGIPLGSKYLLRS